MLADLVAAPFGAAADILASDYPSRKWNGFSFKGLDNIKIATLLSILSTQSPSLELEKWLDALPMIGDGDGPWVYSVAAPAIQLLAKVATNEEDEFEELARSWNMTDEFEGWHEQDVIELLQQTGDLAESALLEGMGLYIWVSL